MRTHRRLLEAENRRQVSTTTGLTLSALPETESCPRCAGPTRFLRSAKRKVVTLAHGPFMAREVVRACKSDCREPSGKQTIVRSQTLARQVAPGAVYGYDVEVHVGLARHLGHDQRQEVCGGLLGRHDIALSTGEESRLAARFVRHLEALHWKRAPQLAEAMRADGGYPMHIDATGEDGRGTTLVVYNAWRQWALGAWKISTERADLVLPRLLQTAQAFGRPCAIMRDLGRAMIEASEQLVLEMEWDIPILGCHTHLLRDMGKDLMKASYDELRELIRRHRLRTLLGALARGLGRPLSAQLPKLRDNVEFWAGSATGHALPAGADGAAFVRSLAQWTLDYAQEGDGLGFPFDRPYLDFYRRCRIIRRAADASLRKESDDASGRRDLLRLARILGPVLCDRAFPQVAAKLSRQAELFERLRQALRLHPDGKARATILSPARAAAELQDVRQAVKRLERDLRGLRPQRGPAQDARHAIDIVLDHLGRHGRSLWGHVIGLPKAAGGGVRLVDRTNNALESFFRRMKQGERRRSGRKVLTHDFEQLPAGAALVANLARPDYVEILCGSLDRLPEAFAELDATQRDKDIAACEASTTPALDDEVLSRSMPYEDRALIRGEALRSWIQSAAQSRVPMAALGGR